MTEVNDQKYVRVSELEVEAKVARVEVKMSRGSKG